MKRHAAALLGLVALVFPLARAADPGVVLQSSEPLIGALESLPETRAYLLASHLPGYGLQINGVYSSGFSPFEPETQEQIISSVTDILNGLSSTVRGLDEGDWVSVAVDLSTRPTTRVVVRLKPGQPDTLEVWLDGVKR